MIANWPPELAYGAYWLWVVLVIFPFCFLFYLWVEKHGMRLGEQLNGKTVVAPNIKPRFERLKLKRVV